MSRAARRVPSLAWAPQGLPFAFGGLRSLPRSTFRSFTCRFLLGGPVGRLRRAFGNMSARRDCQGYQGTGTGPQCSAAMTPATHLHQAPRPLPGGNTLLHPPPPGQPPLPQGGPQGPQHRCPHQPLPVPASCLPGSSSWRKVVGQCGNLHPEPTSLPARHTLVGLSLLLLPLDILGLLVLPLGLEPQLLLLGCQNDLQLLLRFVH